MNRYISWKVINGFVTIPTYNEFDVLKLVYNFFRTFNMREVYKQKVCILEVKNHRANMPDDLLLIEQISHLTHHHNLQELQDECPECTHENIYPNVVSSSGQQVTAILPMLPHYFINTRFYKKHFKLLRMRNLAFGSKYTCAECPNLRVQCEDTFDIIPDLNQINTHTIKDGIICVSYFTLPESEDGELMIPDISDLHELAASYIKFKYWEVEKQLADYMNYNRCNSEYTIAKNEYVFKKLKYTGDKVLQTIDPNVLDWFSQKRVQNLLKTQFR